MITTYPRTNPVNSIVLLILIAVIGGVMYIASQHAYVRHGYVADVVYQVCGDRSQQSIRNPTNGRIANVCQMDDGSWGVRIDARDGTNITAFVRDHARSLRDVVAYLRTNGFTQNLGRGVFP